MKKRTLSAWIIIPVICGGAILATVAGAFTPAEPTTPAAQQDDAPFGGKKDVDFAKKLWKAMESYEDWKLQTEPYKGVSPHGKFVQLFSTWVTVEGRAYPIIIKDNFGGRGVTAERSAEERERWLKAVTIMLQREEGYDKDHQNWYWVKYAPDGSIMTNDKGMKLAGRVAKGMPAGCISCHANAGGNDYLFSNDE